MTVNKKQSHLWPDTLIFSDPYMFDHWKSVSGGFAFITPAHVPSLQRSDIHLNAVTFGSEIPYGERQFIPMKS